MPAIKMARNANRLFNLGIEDLAGAFDKSGIQAVLNQ